MELRPWLTAIGYVQDAAMLVAFIIFLITPKAGRKNFLYVGLVLLAGFVIEVAGWIYWGVFHKNLNPVVLPFDYLVVPLYFFFYKPKLSSQRTVRLFAVLTLINFSFALLNTIFYQGIMIMPTYTMAMDSFVLIIFSVVFFRQLSRELPRQVYVRLPVFWINSAVLIYYVVVLPIYLVTEYLYLTLKVNIIPLWMVHNSIGIIYYIFTTIGLWRNRTLYTPQSSLKHKRD